MKTKVLYGANGETLKVIRRVNAGYDAAQTTDDNRRHWAASDSLSADAANSADIRRTLRNRARYEIANNSYARGIVLTLGHDTIGTGPRLQMQTGNAALDQEIEDSFQQWAAAVKLAAKLRTMRMARAGDGECFGILGSNMAIQHSVKLDVRLVEAEQITAKWAGAGTPNDVDGILLDDDENPLSYSVLVDHPGATQSLASVTGEYRTVPARFMIHVFRAERPGQHRGIPEIMPALPLFAQLRRYTLAVLGAAEHAASMAGWLYTEQPANEETAEEGSPFEQIEFERNMFTVAPYGYKAMQMKAEQPTTTYAEFKKEILNEIARCLNMPFNVAAGNSSGYNYASGRLDHQTYFKSLRVDQAWFADNVLDRILALWLWEYAITPGAKYDAPLMGGPLPRHLWFWDGTEHVDPQKEASAQETRLRNHTTTLADEYARAGKDWEMQLRQRAREAQLMKDLGLTVEKALPAPADEADDKEEESDADESNPS